MCLMCNKSVCNCLYPVMEPCHTRSFYFIISVSINESPLCEGSDSCSSVWRRLQQLSNCASVFLHELKVRCLDTPGQVKMMCGADGDTDAFIYAQETEFYYSL